MQAIISLDLHDKEKSKFYQNIDFCRKMRLVQLGNQSMCQDSCFN